MSSFHLIPKIKPWVPQKHTIGCPMTQALDCGLPPNHPRLDSLDRLMIETPWVWATHLGETFIYVLCEIISEGITMVHPYV